MASSKTKTASEPHCPAVPPPTRRKSLMASVAETQLLPAAPPDQAITRTQHCQVKRGKGRLQAAAGTPTQNHDPLLTEAELATRWKWSPRTLQRRRWLGLASERNPARAICSLSPERRRGVRAGWRRRCGPPRRESRPAKAALRSTSAAMERRQDNRGVAKVHTDAEIAASPQSAPWCGGLSSPAADGCHVGHPQRSPRRACAMPCWRSTTASATWRSSPA